MELQELEHGNTTINFNVRHRFGLHSIINPDLLPQILLLSIIEHKLASKGYSLLHAAAISKNNQAYLLCGRGSSFKTSLCMDFVRIAGFDCLGDDRVILNCDKAFSFWLHPSLFQFLTDYLSDFKQLIKSSRLSPRAKNVLARNNITTMQEFLNLDQAKLSKLRNCGSKTIGEILKFQKNIQGLLKVEPVLQKWGVIMQEL